MKMTVAELIATLQKYPVDAIVAIDDCDTGWAMNIEGARVDDDEPNVVYLEQSGYGGQFEK